MATIHVDIVSAEGEIFSGEAAMVFAPAVMGEMGIAPRHAPLLTTLKPGEVRVQLPSGEEQLFFVGGLVDVLGTQGGIGKHGDDVRLDFERAEEALKDRGSQIELAEAQAELARAVAQLKALEKLRKIRQ
jgi:F-type H+-transporting ATPase subunit epsilon